MISIPDFRQRILAPSIGCWHGTIAAHGDQSEYRWTVNISEEKLEIKYDNLDLTLYIMKNCETAFDG